MMDALDDASLAVVKHGISYTSVGYAVPECLGQYRQLRSQLRIDSGASVLDVGCGLAFGFSQMFDCNYTGIDKSEMMVHGAKLLHGSDIDVTWANFRDLDMSILEFDFIIMSGIFNVQTPWAVITNLVRKAFGYSKIGMGVAYQKSPATDKAFTIYPMRKWLKLFQSLSANITYDASWSKLNAVMTARHEP